MGLPKPVLQEPVAQAAIARDHPEFNAMFRDRKLSKMADEVVGSETPVGFQAVRPFYASFSQVGDDAVIRLLQPRGTASAIRSRPPAGLAHQARCDARRGRDFALAIALGLGSLDEGQN